MEKLGWAQKVTVIWEWLKKELLEELNDILDSFLEFARFKYKIDDWEKNEMVVEVFERIKYEIVQRLEREEAWH